MELTKDAVRSTAKQQEIFSNRIKFKSYLLLNNIIKLKRSAEQKIVFLLNDNGQAIWIGKSIKAMFDLTDDANVVDLAKELKSNPSAYEIGITITDGNYILYKAGGEAETIATITMDSTAGADTVAAVK